MSLAHVLTAVFRCSLLNLSNMVNARCVDFSSSELDNRNKIVLCYRKWTDNTLEGFLHLTLVEGTGLVLTKLDPNETQKKLGVSTIITTPWEVRSAVPVKLRWVTLCVSVTQNR